MFFFFNIGIFETFRPVGVTNNFVYRVIKLLDGTDEIIDGTSFARPLFLDSQNHQNHENLIFRKPARKQKTLSREMKIWLMSISRII